MLTGKKDAYTPMEDTEPKIEVDATDSGVVTPGNELEEHSRAQTPITGGESSGRIFKHGPDDLKVETDRLSKLALSVERDESRNNAQTSQVEPLSTRFRTPGPQMGTLPRADFPTHQTPKLADDQSETVPESAIGNPFVTPHEELGLPPMPLFRIDQLGVDRRMVSIRQNRLWPK